MSAYYVYVNKEKPEYFLFQTDLAYQELTLALKWKSITFYECNSLPSLHFSEGMT